MNISASQYQLFVELRQKLSSGLIIIRSDVAAGKDVTISGGDSTLNVHVPDGIIEVKLPTHVRLLERSGQSSDLKDDGLHIRLRLKVGPCSDIADDVMQNLKAQKKCCVLCQSCGSPLTNERVFKRVLPLPNGNWNTLVDDWCCHPDPFANKKLLPKEDDCLVGDTFYLLTRDISCEQSITQTAESTGLTSTSNQHSDKQVHSHRNAVLMCRKCSVVLGEAVTTETLKLYISDVVVKQVEDETFTFIQDRQTFLERMLASKLVELSSAQSTFRFSIQTPGSKAVIMLWLLNTDTLLAFSERVMSSDDLISSGDAHSIQHPSHQAVSVIKVLYLPCAGCQHPEAVDAWEKDISVHPLILPQSTCEEVLDLLKSSTSTLPSSLRCMNCYQVAYLKR